MSSTRVLFWVQSNLGSGHAARAARIARAMCAVGIQVAIVAGGRRSNQLQSLGIPVHLLPTIVSMDTDIRRLVDEDGKPISSTLWQARQKALEKVAESINPTIVLTEMFPFGRTAFRPELIHMFDILRAKPKKPLIVASVRDILVTKRNPQRNNEMLEIARTYYDRIIVHSDPALVTLDKTFPYAANLNEFLIYSGYVGEDIDSNPNRSRQGIVVSAGGGAVGKKLTDVAISAAHHSRFAHIPWHIVFGQHHGQTGCSASHPVDEKRVVFYSHVENLIDLIGASQVSISQAGYNSTIEAMSSRTPMILVPYAADGEDEQMRRAQLLSEAGWAVMIEEKDLTPESLLDAIENALKLDRNLSLPKIDGAAQTASLLQMMADDKFR